MSTPTNVTLEELLGGTVRMTVLGIDAVSIATEEGGDIIINRIPVEFRAYFKKNTSGHWYSTNLFAYRNDNQETYHPQHPATDNQVRKIYRACVELAEGLSDRALIRGERIKKEREIQTVYDAISMKEEELSALKNLHHALLVEEENAS